MRKATLVVLLGALAAWLLLGRRRAGEGAPPRVVVGFADGSVETVEPETPLAQLLVAAAAEALSR